MKMASKLSFEEKEKKVWASLSKIKASGEKGFEGLICKLLQDITGLCFLLCCSGDQNGRDFNTNKIYVECKRYNKSKTFNKRELLGEVVQAQRSNPSLDAWILVATKKPSAQIVEAILNCCREKGLFFSFFSFSDGEPSTLLSLLASNIKETLEYIKKYDPKNINSVKKILEQTKKEERYESVIKDIKKIFSDPTVGFDNWRKSSHEYFLRSISSEDELFQNCNNQVVFIKNNENLICRVRFTVFFENWFDNLEKGNKICNYSAS
jgi:hypothetical protein